MAEHVPRAMTREVEVRVVDQVHDRRRVGPALHRHADLPRVELVGGADLERPRETHLAVGRGRLEPDGGPPRVEDGGPHLAVEPVPAAVLVVGPLVAVDLDLPAVEVEAAARDTVPIASARRPEVGIGGRVAGHVVEAEHDVGEGSDPVGNVQLHEACPEIDEPGANATVRGHGVGMHGRAIDVTEGGPADHGRLLIALGMGQLRPTTGLTNARSSGDAGRRKSKSAPSGACSTWRSNRAGQPRT